MNNDESRTDNPKTDGTPGGNQPVSDQSQADSQPEILEDGEISLEVLPKETAGSPSITVETSVETNQMPALPYPVVGFGASAGGLQAFRDILEELSPNTGMSFILVSHLAPDQKSFLSEILERYTTIPVAALEDGQRPEPNHLYVLQPNQSLTLRDGRLEVENSPAGERPHKVIDRFFYSLAADQKNHAIGVVLSGADADGALGLKAIKGEGGITLVQSPESAIQTGMPLSSISSDHVDLVIPPAEIGIELNRLAHQFTRPEVRSLESGAVAVDDATSYQKTLHLLRTVSGLDLRQYKPETIRRRIARRMLLLRIDYLSQYFRFLQARTDELRRLQEDVLINVTRFFRDPEVWDSLRMSVLPTLMQDRPPERPIRIWCAGCSSGEEAYSLGITVLEYLSQNGLETPVQIFGTDASDDSIEKARVAVYPETIANEISPERLRRYFIKVDRGYQVSKRVRDACIFARQNLANDPPFSHIDILSCRNVMIYFNQALQRQVMLTFHYALESRGYMVLGMSEGLRDYGDVFTAVDRKHKIYMKTGNGLPHALDLPHRYSLTQTSGLPRISLAEMESNVWPELELQRAADRIVLARFGPPGLVVDDRLNVLQSRGQASQFLEITPGAVSWNLLRVIREGLAGEVRNTLQRAIHENVPVSGIATMVDEQNGEQQVQIEILPITGTSSRPRCFLILFQAAGRDEAGKPVEQPLLPQLTEDEKERLIAQLRQELTSTRFHLQSLIEERDARNQELVSANEEIQSANEELQSTNEELETTKEELQSANEELQTVNDELQQRNNILTQTGNDLTNLLNSVNIPLLMLTSDLQIRQFTPPMQKLLSVRAADIGRSINEIRLQLSIESIEPILNEVLETLGTREIEVQDREGRWHLLRVRPYRTAENKIEGLVVVLLDIDQLRRSQQHLIDARDFASSVLESVPVPVVVLNEDLTIRTDNSAFRQLTQQEQKQLAGRSMPDLVKNLWGIDRLREKLKEALAGSATLEFEHESTTAQHKTLLINARALHTDGNRVLLLMVQDITLRREAERLVAMQNEALENEIQVAERQLNRTQEELRGLTAHLFTAQEDERQRVARELHDDISQRMSHLEISLQKMAVKNEGKNEELEDALELLSALNTDVRQISHGLHPAVLTDLGLPVALQSLVSEFGEREGMPVTFAAEDVPEKLPEQAEITIYRIAQEALRNISKHAGRTHVKVSLTGSENRLRLKVMDFGLGFDQQADMPSHGLGLISMQERARLAGGTLTIRSALGQGTTVMADLPLDHHA